MFNAVKGWRAAPSRHHANWSTYSNVFNNVSFKAVVSALRAATLL